MITFSVPGDRIYRIGHLLCDFNGTLAVDGALLPGVPEALTRAAESVSVHILTADTFGTVREATADLPVQVEVLSPNDQVAAKGRVAERLGAEHVVALGNGRNDEAMLRTAALGICILQAEGAHAATLRAADLVCASPVDAVELLLNTKRLVATLRR